MTDDPKGAPEAPFNDNREGTSMAGGVSGATEAYDVLRRAPEAQGTRGPWYHPAMRAVEAAVDAALSEVRRQGGADYLLREARTDGINEGARRLGRPARTFDGQEVPSSVPAPESTREQGNQGRETLVLVLDALARIAAAERRAQGAEEGRLHEAARADAAESRESAALARLREVEGALAEWTDRFDATPAEVEAELSQAVRERVDLAMELTLTCNSFENAYAKVPILTPERVAILKGELDASRALAAPHLPPEPWHDKAPCHRRARALSPAPAETERKE